MIKTSYQAGDNVVSLCRKCGDTMGHVVVAVVEGTVVKVQCKICNSVHKFRPPEAEKAKAERKARTAKTPAKKKPAPLPSDAWEKELAKRDTSNPLPYATTNAYSADDVINHPKFGLGVVLATIKPNKMEVLFQDGAKLMLCTL